MVHVHKKGVCFPYFVPAGNLEFKNLEGRPIVYFCAEYGIEDDLPLYAGGLGVLAGDFVREAGAQGVPLVAVGLMYHYGFKTSGDSKKDRKRLDPSDFGFVVLKSQAGDEINIDVEAGDRIVYVRVWVKTYGSAHLFLLDADIELNTAEDRKITDNLYDGDFDRRVLQELILGVGGVKLVRTLDISPSIYHLNEGHTSFAVLALALEYLHDNPTKAGLQNACNAVKPAIVATKHTILPGAGLHFTKQEFTGIVDRYLKRHNAFFDEFFELGHDESHPEMFSTTKFLLSNAIRGNAVSMLHGVFEKKEHPHSTLISITNGVNSDRWTSPLWPDGGIAQMSDKEIWEVHSALRAKLARFVKKETGANLNPSALTVVWARRLAAYKRPNLLFKDLERLEKLISRKGEPVQFIIAGEASSADREGTELVRELIHLTKNKKFKDKIVYLPNYSIDVARELISGSDVWLSTPERGKEACGTSSMKSSLNGVLQFSTSDGWIEEVDWNDKGWVLPDFQIDENLYAMLETEIIPAFYDRGQHKVPYKWVKKMRATMSIVEGRYTSRRMLEEYLNRLYFPSNRFPYKLN